MKALSLTVLIGMTTLMACSPFGNPPTSLPTPTASPSGDVNPSIEPTIYPTWTPSPDMPIPMVTPSAGAEDLRSKTEADIEARREFSTITHALLNPEQSRILYTYSKTLQIDFKNWYSNPATKTVRSGLWAFDRQTGQHQEVVPAQDSWSYYYPDARWINNLEIIYIDSESRALVAKNVLTGKTRTVFDSQHIRQFDVHQNDLFVLHVKDDKQYLLRINLSTQERLEREIPYKDFYQSATFGILNRDTVLLGQFKAFYKDKQYPFKVATTSPPPILDSFLLNLAQGSSLPIENGLDLGSFESLEVSADQVYFATVRGSSSQFYTMQGKLILEAPGVFNWLDGNHVLLKEGRKMTTYALQGETAQQMDQFTTQTECSEIQGASPTFMQCPVHTIYSSDSVSRVFQVNPLNEIAASQTIEGYYDDKQLSSQLLPKAPEQMVRMVETFSTKEGYSSLLTLNAAGKSNVLMRLNNPTNPNFKFDPQDYTWSSSY